MRAADVVPLLLASEQAEELPSCSRCRCFMLTASFILVFGGSRLVFGHVSALLEDRTALGLRWAGNSE
jgi:hypothetical protein